MERLLPTMCLCMALVFYAVSPALAQDGDQERDGDVTVVDCSQVVNVFSGAFANQGQYANALANALAGSLGDEATAAIAQYLDVSVDQVNRCLGGPDDGPDDGPSGGGPNDGPGGNPDGQPGDPGAGNSDDRGGDGDPREGVIARTVVDDDLPDTGGVSPDALAPFALPTLALLVAGGIFAARIVRRS